MPGKSGQYGPNVRSLLASADHSGRMTAVPVPAPPLERHLPPGPALARAARMCRRNSPGEGVARTADGCAHARASRLPIHACALLMLLPLGSAAVHAETVASGRMGPTSRGTVHISLSVAPKLEVNRSPVVASESGRGADRTQSFCVWSNSSVGSYSISASDASDRSTAEPAGTAFPFAVQLIGAGAGALPLLLAPGVSATGLAAAPQGGCGSERLDVRPAQMAGGEPAAPRSGALLLLIAPD